MNELLRGLANLRGKPTLPTPRATLTVSDQLDLMDLPPLVFQDTAEHIERDGRTLPPWWFDDADLLPWELLTRVEIAYRRMRAAQERAAKLDVGEHAPVSFSAALSEEDVRARVAARMARIDLTRTVKAVWAFDEHPLVYVGLFNPDPFDPVLAVACKGQIRSKTHPDQPASRTVYTGEQAHPAAPGLDAIIPAVRAATEDEWKILAARPELRLPPTRKDKPYKPPAKKRSKPAAPVLDASQLI